MGQYNGVQFSACSKGVVSGTSGWKCLGERRMHVFNSEETYDQETLFGNVRDTMDIGPQNPFQSSSCMLFSPTEARI